MLSGPKLSLIALQSCSNIASKVLSSNLELALQTNSNSGDLTSLEPVLTVLADNKLSCSSIPPPGLLQIVDAASKKILSDKKLITSPLSLDHLSRSPPSDTSLGRPREDTSRKLLLQNLEVTPGSSAFETFTIPLKSDGQFFNVLAGDLQALNALHEDEEANLSKDINYIAQALALFTSNKSQTSVQPWREIFRLYLDCNIFFSTLEQGFHRNSAAAVQGRLKIFTSKLHETGLLHKFKKDVPRLALDRFLRLNLSLLRHLRYQELNKVAMMKILKSEARFSMVKCTVVDYRSRV